MSKKDNSREAQYAGLFAIAIPSLFLGILLANPAFLAAGVVFLIIALANRQGQDGTNQSTD
jgi:hypothetical protein